MTAAADAQLEATLHMTHFRKVVLVVAALVMMGIDLTAVPAAFAADPLQLHVEFEARAVTIRGVNPHGEVLVYSVHRQQIDFHHGHTSSWQLASVDGNGGTVRLTTPAEIEPDRLWVIVDQATGRYVITRTDDKSAVDHSPPGLLKKQSDAKGDLLTVPLAVAHLLVVRPGEDAWLTEVADGGAWDDDGAQNNAIRVRPDRLSDYRHKGRKNDKFSKGDLVIAIEPVSLRVMEERLQ